MNAGKEKGQTKKIVQVDEQVQPTRMKSLIARKDYILKLSVIPIVVCFIAFTRSTIYRLTRVPEGCKSFGWYSSSSAESSCDHKPLDWHASLAILWLITFTLQVFSLMGKLNWFHKFFGKFGLVFAVFNVLGMLYLSVYDLLYPMEKTDRPKVFSIFMFITAIKIGNALRKSMVALQKHDYDAHMIWMFRAFITSFTTPVIRFYPLVLRSLAGDDCFHENRHLFVMGSMFAAEILCTIMYILSQRYTQKVFMDRFMQTQIVVALLVGFAEFYWVQDHSLFLVAMTKCAVGKY